MDGSGPLRNSILRGSRIQQRSAKGGRNFYTLRGGLGSRQGMEGRVGDGLASSYLLLRLYESDPSIPSVYRVPPGSEATYDDNDDDDDDNNTETHELIGSYCSLQPAACMLCCIVLCMHRKWGRSCYAPPLLQVHTVDSSKTNGATQTTKHQNTTLAPFATVTTHHLRLRFLPAYK